MSEMLKGKMRIEVPFLPPVEYSLNWGAHLLDQGSLRLLTNDITGGTSLIGFLTGRTATNYANALGLFSSMFSPKSSLADIRAKLSAAFIERRRTTKGAFAILTLQFNRFMSVQAFKRTVNLSCSQPVRRTVNFLSAMCAVFEQTTTHRCDLTAARAVFFVLFLPRRIGAKLLTASGARASHVGNIIERVDAEFSLGFIIPPENVSDYLSNLRVISPYYSCASIKNKFGHVIEISALLVALIEQNTYPKSIVGIRHEALVGILNLPANPLLGFPCLARGIDSPIFVNTESGALFGDWLPQDGQMNADAGLRYSSRPCQNIRLGSNHIVNIPSFSRESKVEAVVDLKPAPLTIIELEEIKKLEGGT